MELEIYTWIGKIAVWLGFVYVTFKILAIVLEYFINWLGDRCNNMWKFIEYLYYRTSFKEWIKDKERLNRFKDD